MSEIHLLSSHVADLIAAGEVVERPASAVKELMENAIDAGAAAITVEIRDGGMTYMRITDNGGGIAPEDAETAFLRHATSKLRDEKGLEAIATLGFRGEALAAIAAVSKIEMLTRLEGAEEGMSLYMEGGAVTGKAPAGCPTGTTMIVRDLFYNTPARLKFMKSDKAEGAAVSAAVLRTALSHPELSVKYIKDGKEECHTPGDGRLESCIYSLLGRAFWEGLIPAVSSDDNVKVTGFVTSPMHSRGNRGHQFFFVNGRFVKSGTLQAALEQAYRNSETKGRFPGAVLYITVKHSAVDVNVHPTKTEVKFLNERQVFDGVYYAALSALERERAQGEIKIPAREVPAREQPRTEAMSRTDTTGTAFGSIFKNSISGEKGGVPSAGKEIFCREPAITVENSRYQPISDSTRVAYRSGSAVSVVKPIDIYADDEDQEPGGEPSRQEQSPVASDKIALFEESAPEQKGLPEIGAEQPGCAYRMIGEALSTYIIAEQEDCLLLIDKHAAHERVIFDRLSAENHEIMTQMLLTPVTLRPGVQETQLILENAGLLEEFGFDVGAFGEDSVAVRQVPSDIDLADVPDILSEFCENLESGRRQDPQGARDQILHTLACKAAIKAGRLSEPEELAALTRRVVSGEIKYCPHGRPVAVRLTKAELDKHFKRG